MRYFSRSTAVVLVAAGLSSLALGAWVATPPSAVGAYARGAPKDWSYLHELRREHAGLALRHPYVPLSRISLDLQLAVTVGEDAGFLGHGTFDTAEIREALYEWARGGRLRGASTLSQQLAKNLFLSDARSIVRKVREARYAWWLERRLGKRRILELYLNVIELGEGTLGVEAGSRLYFGVPASSLDARQAAELAAAIPSPLGNNPATRTPAWRARYAAIQARMQRFDWLRQELLALNGGQPALAGGGRSPRLPAGGAGAAVSGVEAGRGPDAGVSAAEAPDAGEVSAGDDAAGSRTGAVGGASAGGRDAPAGSRTAQDGASAGTTAGSPATSGAPPGTDAVSAPEAGAAVPPSRESRATPGVPRGAAEDDASGGAEGVGPGVPGSGDPE